MNNTSQPPAPPQPGDFGLEASEALDEGAQMIKIAGLGVPSSLSPRINWVLGLCVGLPLGLWTLWGFVSKLDSLVLGISIGLLGGIIVFQLAVSVAPLTIDVALYGIGLMVDEISSLFSDRARRRIAYRKAWRAYRNEKARGGYGGNEL